MNAADVQMRLKTENTELEPAIAMHGNTSIFYLATKRLLDMMGALLGIVLLSPLLLGVAIAVRATSRGNAIYRQTRVGKGGREFQIYKFRTMVEDAEDYGKYLTSNQIAYYQTNRKLEEDPRVTRVGQTLRRTSADELPQLLNVLLGNMSLVGPRPMLKEEIEQYGNSFALYKQMRPGITGLWQVTKRHSTRMSSRAVVDCKYFQERSLKKDFLILVRTAMVVLNQDGAC